MTTYITQEGNERRAMTDAEVIATFAPQVTLSAKKTTVNADGEDFVTINVQLKSLPLSDDKQVELNLVHPVILLVGSVEIRVDTDENGRASHDLEFSDEGVYTIGTKHLNGNTLTITAV